MSSEQGVDTGENIRSEGEETKNVLCTGRGVRLSGKPPKKIGITLENPIRTAQ